ncbi:MAG: PHP-associated domain-containing protein [Nitrosopumilaceae archaeon]
MNILKTELHCHNQFSNFQLGLRETPFDCGVTISDQLEQAHKLGLDALFITNHNTLNGFTVMLDYKENHEALRDLHVYPAEEITTNTGTHIIAYGISETIKSGQTIEEILDKIRAQDAISCAPHPFGLNNGLREKAILCDLIEVFNSNNVDRYSNIRATHFAKTNNMIQVAGSDSHVLSTLGRCANLIESENNLDSILAAMRKGKISIGTTGYITSKEMIEHAKYKIANSKDDIIKYFRETHPNLTGLCTFLIGMFESNPNSLIWTAVYKIAVHMSTKLSNKVNFKNYDHTILYERNLRAILPMILT